MPLTSQKERHSDTMCLWLGGGKKKSNLNLTKSLDPTPNLHEKPGERALKEIMGMLLVKHR